MSLHRGQIGHINIYALHNCQYALFSLDVMCQYILIQIQIRLILSRSKLALDILSIKKEINYRGRSSEMDEKI